MRLIEIKTQENGSHNNVTWDIPGVPPVEWAVIPDDMVCDNFPFGEVETEDINGIMTVTKWTAGVMPEPIPLPEEEPTSDELMDILLGVSE